ncbi:MAG: hypothetical protein IT538_04555 [Variibacter sp.]|nr:hypothetical protein [Variibacter sp.]
MEAIVFEEGAVQIDAAVVSEGFGIPSGQLLERMRAGSITGICERGIGDDSGRHRLTFFSPTRRIRLVVDEAGAIIQRSAVDFGSRAHPAADG